MGTHINGHRTRKRPRPSARRGVRWHPPARFGGTSWRRESSAGDGGTRVSDHVGTSAPGVAMRSTFTAPPMVVAVTRLNEPERQWNPDRPAPHLLSGV